LEDDILTNQLTGAEWCKSDHSQIVPTKYHRYYIRNCDEEEEDDIHHENGDWDGDGNSEEARGEFRIHEDGNYDTLKGTQGCIGTHPGNMGDPDNPDVGLWQRLADVWADLSASGKAGWLPLFAYTAYHTDDDADGDGNPGETRGGDAPNRLLVHPDGGPQGTHGCIGIQGYGLALAVDRRLTWIKDHHLPENEKLPLFVVTEFTTSPEILDDWVWWVSPY